MLLRWFISILLLCLLINIVYGDYIGAVVEYNPLEGPTPETTIEENLKNYIFHIEQAKVFGVQIIVFPEYGLTTFADNPENYSVAIPDVGTTNFLNESFVLLKLCNAALEHEMYVVANLYEKSNITDGTLTYNTNVVFSSNGSLVAKHRKMNLYHEPKITPGNETTIFKTTFGTFGVITCADIIYYNPSQTVLENTGVTDVIFPTAWTSEFPFYMALSIQHGYALANKVNLLAANLNDPSMALGSSSIISSDGIVLRRILTDTASNNIAYANLKRPGSATRNLELMGFNIFQKESRQPLSNFKNLTDFWYDDFLYKPISLSAENITEEICDGNFCCNFEVIPAKGQTNTSEVYKLVAYQGPITYDSATVPIKICALLGCVNDDIASCGVWPPTAYSTVFRQITVWGNWEAESGLFVRPVNIRGNWEPSYNVTYLENKTNETVGVSFNTTQPIDDLVSFGLYVTGSGEFRHPWSWAVLIMISLKFVKYF
ncbi:vanin-like protein 1 [Anthonomus grandis grandis]|uniref:vanin-like protein 1 n=1 Tax=Anthonomus grandis grandis TaxID=2921223 RepID=UPI002166544B|nr:vanin-like protein 1 [Anthonomus grandis grandis]